MGSTLLFAFLAIGNIQPEAEVRVSAGLRMVDEEIPSGALPPQRPPERIELEMEPRLAARTDGSLRVVLSYAPRLQIPIEERSEREAPSPWERANILHNDSLDAERQVDRWTLRGGGSASYGMLDPLDHLANVEDAFVAGSRQLPYKRFGVRLGLTGLLTRRLTLDLDARASTSGGDGEAAQRTLPTQEEGTFESALGFQATRRDTYAGLLSVAVSTIDRGTDALTLRGGARWNRILSRASTVRVEGGLAYSMEQDGADVETEDSMSSLGPWAQGSFAYELGERRPGLTFSAGIEPGIDRLLGSVTTRTYAELRSHWAPVPDWLFAVYGQVATWEPRAPRDPSMAGRTWIRGVGGSMAYFLSRNVAIGTRLSSIWQESPREDLRDFQEFTAMVEMNTLFDI